MQLISLTPPISEAVIPLLLQWWQQRKRLASSASVLSSPVLKDTDENYLEACHRMMEIYSVVKAGGVQAQRQAALAHLQREQAALQTAMKALEPSAQVQLEAEVQELTSATDWRLAQLSQIGAVEEQAVQRYLKDIERVLMR